MIFLFFVIWALLVVWTIGAFCAHFQHDCSFYTADADRIAEHQRREFRGDMWLAVGFALNPLTMVLSPILTSGYAHGWRIRPPKVLG